MINKITNSPRVILTLSILFPILVFGQEFKDLEKFEWILGNWISEEGNNLTIENWKSVSPNTFEGKSIVTAKGNDKKSSIESLRLVNMNDEIFYIAKVSHNRFPVAFKLTSFIDSTAAFENHLHEFPKKIEYRLINSNNISVNVSDGEKGFTVNFKRKD